MLSLSLKFNAIKKQPLIFASRQKVAILFLLSCDWAIMVTTNQYEVAVNDHIQTTTKH